MNEKGSVTVYSLIIIVPIVLFMGLLYDFVRYQAAEWQAENTLKAAARSVLSAFDRELRSKYGLFGLAANTVQQLKIVKETVNGEEDAEPGNERGSALWTAVKPVVSDVTVKSLYTLADHRFFRHQIMEEMKVKAPVEFTRHVYDKWKGQAPRMEEAHQLHQLSEQTEQWLERREKRLREAFHSVEQMEQWFAEGKSILSEPDEQSKTRLASVFSRLQQLLNETADKLTEAEQAEAQLVESMDSFDNNQDLINGVYILGHQFYNDYRFNVSVPVSMFGAVINLVESNPGTALDHRYEAEYFEFLNSKRSEEEQRRSKFDELEEKKQAERDKTKRTVSQARDAMALQVCGPDEEKHYVELAENYRDYLAANSKSSGNSDSINPAIHLEQSPEQLQKSSLFGLSELSRMLRNIRDEAYINEYAMMYFNNRTTSLSTNPLIAHIVDHPLQDQEIEYILYGLPSCTGNRAAAYAELFTIRFAIRTVEALKDARKAALGSPILIMLTAAAEGAVKAQQDMDKLLKGEALPLSAFMPSLSMGYADYLRAFMTLHTNETNKMARIQALIQLNTGIDLADRPVYIQAESRTKVALWMFPALSIRIAGQKAEEGDEAYALIAKTAVMAY